MLDRINFSSRKLTKLTLGQTLLYYLVDSSPKYHSVQCYQIWEVNKYFKLKLRTNRELEFRTKGIESQFYNLDISLRASILRKYISFKIYLLQLPMETEYFYHQLQNCLLKEKTV